MSHHIWSCGAVSRICNAIHCFTGSVLSKELSGVPPAVLSSRKQKFILGVVAESVECGPHVQDIGSLVPGRVKPMTYKDFNSLLPGRVFGINRIGQGLVSSVSG